MLPNFAYVRARSLDDAVDQLSTQGARLHAGGTDLLGCLHDEVFEARKVVSISGLRGLSGVQETPEGGLRIGALTTVAQVAAHPLIRARYPGLAQGASEVASPQLRNQGTIGGNLCQKPRCWYYRGEFHCLRKGGPKCFAVGGRNPFHCILGGDGCYIVHPSDTAPPLVALDAAVRVAGPRGTRVVPVEQLHVPPERDPQRETVLEPGEIVTEVILPPVSPKLRSTYRKVRARRSWDFALAGVALALEVTDRTVTQSKVVLSGAAPVPWRSRKAESALTGREVDETLAAEAADAALAEATPLPENGFKLPLFRGLLIEEFLAAAG